MMMNGNLNFSIDPQLTLREFFERMKKHYNL